MTIRFTRNVSMFFIFLFADGLISVHGYPSYEPKMQLHKAKGASYFATFLKVSTCGDFFEKFKWPTLFLHVLHLILM